MNLRRLIALLLALLALTSHSVAGLVHSLLVPTEDVPAGSTLELNWLVANTFSSEARAEVPADVAAVLRAGNLSWPVHLTLVSSRSTVISAQSFAYNSYSLAIPKEAEGLVTLELEQPWNIRAAFKIVARPVAPAQGAPAAEPTPAVVPAPLDQAGGSQAAVSRFQRAFTDRFGTHQPIYFIFGPDKPAAKFQFSFKYRLLSDTNSLHSIVPALRSLYFGYTQRSLWDITSDSSPFYDTSYMPELFFESLEPHKDGRIGEWLGYQVGFQHESNGRDGFGSRSLNVAYLRPMFALGHAGSWALVFSPKLVLDVDSLSDNPDLRRYRGYGEYTLTLTKNDNLSLTTIGRIGNKWDRGSIQVDLNYPLRVRYGNFATFLLLQYFDGYGESLLRYNQKSRVIRAGFGLVR